MGKEKMNYSANEAWKQLIQKYVIEDAIKRKGLYYITAKAIKEFKEPRLMAKWDSTESLPDVLRKKKINILPISRGEYVLSDFDLYQPIPKFVDVGKKVESIQLPDEYETVDIQNISSESNAINVLLLTKALDLFLESEGTVETFNGRMGTGQFSFDVNSFSGVKRHVEVNNAQCEIDGGFENSENVVIMEAKNVLHDDFHVRQLYYPFRLWSSKVRKPIRLIFSQYSNMVFRIFEYGFENPNDYSSIVLLKEKYYSLEATNITSDNLIEVRGKVQVKFDDKYDKDKPPFPQADSMERVISLAEHLYDNSMSRADVANLMDFTERQSDYYFNALRYLGLAERVKSKERGENVYTLTSLGNNVIQMNYRRRQLKIVELLLEHQIFSELFDKVQLSGEYPDKKEIQACMIKYRVIEDENANSVPRRASTVLHWLRWIFGLVTL